MGNIHKPFAQIQQITVLIEVSKALNLLFDLSHCLLRQFYTRLIRLSHQLNDRMVPIPSHRLGNLQDGGDRIQAFVEQTSIPQPMLSILQALPNTALWERLKKEQRLIEGNSHPTGDQNTLMNFIPTRSITDVAREYVEGFWTLYEPQNYLRRCLQQCLKIGSLKSRKQTMQFPLNKGLQLVAQLIWHQGIRRPEIRRQFWYQLWIILFKKP